uniref:Glial cell line-derived neurotrophic factor n=1 Tax=Globodera pallida TaxID=36090 RepID=A0A183BIZ8_GLOPA
MPSSPIVPQRVLVLTIAAVLVDFMPSVAALRCSIGAKITMEYDDDSLEMMKKKIPLIELLGELEAFRMLFKLDGIIQCPAGATRCMTAQCTFNLNSLPEVPAKYRDLLDDHNLMIIFRACAPRVGCNTDALQGPLDDHDLQQGPFPMKRTIGKKATELNPETRVFWP